MLAAVLPNIGGWGPREGVTAWAFGAAGLGASLGVATAVVYGVMVFVAMPAGRRGPRRRLGAAHPVGAVAPAAASGGRAVPAPQDGGADV